MNCTTAKRKPNQTHYPHLGNIINEFFNTAVGDVILKSEAKYFTNPATNVVEFDDRYELALALPGYDKDSVAITIEDDRLSITGKSSEDDKQHKYRLREWNNKGFSKHFKLADTIDQTLIEAAFEQGILSIVLKKKEEAIPQPPKSITIK